MGTVLRSAFIYLFILVSLRIVGKRSLRQLTTFDLVLLLIISATIQRALLGNDSSMVNTIIAVLTLLLMDIGISLWKHRSPRLSTWLDGRPLILVEDGHPIQEHLDKEGIDEGEILAQARQSQGLERMDQIKYAVLESNGSLSIIPKEGTN